MGKEKTGRFSRRSAQEQMEAPPIEFNRGYEDRITGFRGICVGMCQYISGCDQVLLQPPLDKDGKHVHALWFDDVRLIDVESRELAKTTSGRGADGEAPIK